MTCGCGDNNGTEDLPQLDAYDNLLKKSKGENRFFHAMCELTYRCNVDCVHCYCVRDHGGDELTLDDYCRLFDMMVEEGVLMLSFTGGGSHAPQRFLGHHAGGPGSLFWAEDPDQCHAH